MKINDTIEKQNEERHAVGNNQLFYGKLTEEEKRDFCDCLAHAYHYGQASRECEVMNLIFDLQAQINAKSRGYKDSVDLPENWFHGLTFLQQKITMDGQIRRKKHGAETFKNSADEFYTLYFDDDEAATAEVVSH